MKDCYIAEIDPWRVVAPAHATGRAVVRDHALGPGAAHDHGGRRVGGPGAHDTAERGNYQPSYDEIAAAAYQRYLSRGGAHGQDFEDWLQAERELQQGKRR